MPKTETVPTDVIARARAAFAQDPDLLQQLTPLLNAADGGDQAARDIFAKSVGQSGSVDYGQLLRLLAGFASRAHTGIDPTPPRAKTLQQRADVLLPPHVTLRSALKRAEQLDLLSMMPADAEAKIFDGMEYARDERVEGSAASNIEKVRTAMAERVGKSIVKAFREARELGAAPLPPPAGDTSDDYGAGLVRLMGLDAKTFDAWTIWPNWRSALACQFIDLLMNVREAGTSPNLAERMEQAIAFKRHWYIALGLHGLEDADLMQAVNTLYPDTRSDMGLQALAELARFVKPDDDSLMRHPSSARLLASAIVMLHGMAPFLEEDRFLRLLPPFAYPMTMEGAMEMLQPRGRRGNRSALFKAQSILMWHTPPSQEQATRLLQLVKEAGGKFKGLDHFSQGMLNVTPSDMARKIAEFEGDGVSVTELVGAIEDRFPHQLAIDNAGAAAAGDASAAAYAHLAVTAAGAALKPVR